MYDRVTENLIRGVPEMANLDRAELPKKLTDAFAAIVSLRVRLQKLQLTTEEAGELDAQISLLRRLGNVYETLACVLDRDDPARPSCAFVAATAHQLLRRVFASDGKAGSIDHLEPHGVSSSIAAMLLFMIAGAFPDATEMAQYIQSASDGSVEQLIQRGLVALACGQISEIVDLPQDPLAVAEGATLEQQATNLLWSRIYLGLRVLASELLGHQISTVDGSSFQIFNDVKELSVTQWEAAQIVWLMGPGEVKSPSVFQIFGGPHHLATLLLASGEILQQRSVLRVPCPSADIDEAAWKHFLGRLARTRPCLWPNHLDAIDKGLLAPDVSAAISFPTGAGKSTVIQLKIAVTLLCGRAVIFLAPTHALVDQVKRDLLHIFPGGGLDLAGEDDEDSGERPRISVMTPERCLSRLSSSFDVFSAVGLVVFDECHMLHSRDLGDDRRSLDAMLCLLNLFEAAPDADFVLLSAMMANAKEIGEWIAAATERECLALDLDWKPTRQARGCVVYLKDEVDRLKTILFDEQTAAIPTVARGKGKTPKGPSVDVRRKMTAYPYALFSLRNAWVTRSGSDYSLCRLLSRQVTLAVSAARGSWSLTANRNKVSALLAAAYASAGIKTMVLAQAVRDLPSLAKDAEAELDESVRAIVLRPEEEVLLQDARDELGGDAHVVRPINGRVAIHHGMLLPAERRLGELLFGRKDGVTILVVSPTLAQGVNLPAEAVIIAGDDRWDQGADKRRKLEAQDLLNAAGRAGRAGSASLGVVLVVPGEAVIIDPQKGTLEKRWFDLQERAFSKSDQCLNIQDPLQLLLDQFDVVPGVDPGDDFVAYFLRRLPVSDVESDEKARQFLGRSLAAFHARKNGRKIYFDSLVEHVIAARKARCGHGGTWHDAVSSATGVPAWIVRELDAAVQGDTQKAFRDVPGWVEWFLGWIEQDSRRADIFLTSPLIKCLFRGADEPVPRAASFYVNVLAVLRAVVVAWMNGAALREIEIMLGTAPEKLGHCFRARELVLRHMAHVAAAVSLVARVVDARAAEEGTEGASLSLTKSGSCIREGVSSPDKLAVYVEMGEPASRVRAHRLFDAIAHNLEPGSLFENFGSTRRRVRDAIAASAVTASRA